MINAGIITGGSIKFSRLSGDYCARQALSQGFQQFSSQVIIRKFQAFGPIWRSYKLNFVRSSVRLSVRSFVPINIRRLVMIKFLVFVYVFTRKCIRQILVFRFDRNQILGKFGFFDSCFDSLVLSAVKIILLSVILSFIRTSTLNMLRKPELKILAIEY